MDWRKHRILWGVICQTRVAYYCQSEPMQGLLLIIAECVHSVRLSIEAGPVVKKAAVATQICGKGERLQSC